MCRWCILEHDGEEHLNRGAGWTGRNGNVRLPDRRRFTAVWLDAAD